MANYDRLFSQEKNTPSSWSIGGGVKSSIAFANDIWKRDMKEIVAAAKKYGFVKNSSVVTNASFFIPPLDAHYTNTDSKVDFPKES